MGTRERLMTHGRTRRASKCGATAYICTRVDNNEGPQQQLQRRKFFAALLAESNGGDFSPNGL